MSKETHEIDVANDRIITLPGLTEEDKERARSQDMRVYIRHGVHHPDWIGFPNANDDFRQTGIVIQTLDDQTARALLVIDEAEPLNTLAVLKFAYDHMGYVLHIDHATVLRQLSNKKNITEDVLPETLPSMEVA
ncbi:MAG: hypothetical protein HN541_00385 [Euryarchaeota archaeon]|jgi:hypothetical protein|nr:hypothetical protein [Euryarchaeota archaeon]